VDVTATQEAQPTAAALDFRTEPSRYKHWRISFDGPVATLTMDVAEDGGIRPGYNLKLNSYDLGVDIELHDALQRIRSSIRNSLGRHRQRPRTHFLFWRQHLHLGLFSRLES